MLYTYAHNKVIYDDNDIKILILAQILKWFQLECAQLHIYIYIYIL